MGLDGESEAYRQQRAALLQAEIALRDQIERVAALRRSLPDGPAVPDWSFEEGPSDLGAGDAPVRPVRLSGLFDRPDQTLILMQFMFGGQQTQPCPMCTLWADGYDGIVPQLRERVSFGVVFAGEVAPMRAWARARGWRNLRLLSSAGNPMKRLLGFEAESGSQLPGVSVFRLGDDGQPRHVYSQCAMLAPGEFRGMDLLSPLWSFLDLTPEGRGDWMPRRREA